MANVFDVAKYILDTVGGDISAMKLQKLCYYCQAWNLVWEGEPLFKEEFLRWDNGPVCKELFNLHKGMYFANGEKLFTGNENFFSKEGLSTKQTENIDGVLDEYMHFEGSELSEMTHQEDPWKNTKKNKVIEKEQIKEFYAQRINK